MTRRALYLAVHGGRHRYLVADDGDLARAASFYLRDAALAALRDPAPIDDDLVERTGGVGVIDATVLALVERIAGATSRPARARSDDRDTSHAAARSINPDTVRGRVLAMLRRRCGAGSLFTLADAVRWYDSDASVRDWRRASASSVRTRVSELVDDGFVEATPGRERAASGRSMVLFRLVA